MPSLPLTRRADAAVPVSADTPVPFARISFALFLAGFSTFSLLYCVQPLLPEFARDFGLSPAQSSLALSLATGALALAIFTMGALSQALPRRGLMATSMVLAALLNLAAAWRRAGRCCWPAGCWKAWCWAGCPPWPWPTWPRRWSPAAWAAPWACTWAARPSAA
jgi:MFS family permease